MAMQSFHDQNEDAVMGEINMTPLVDVMLVLLIVFIITVPVLQHAVPLSLPSANSAPEQLKPDHIQIAIDAQGQTFWNGQPVVAEALPERMRTESGKQPQPVVQLRADRNVRYDAVARTLAAAQPLRADQLIAPWAVQQGQNVKTVSSGAGFSVSSDGKALNNAAEGQVVQVRTNTGQTVSGIACPGGIVEISH